MRAWYLGGGLHLVACLLIGNVVGQYRALWPLCRDRGLCGSPVMLEASLRRFDAGYASVGLLAGLASLAVVWWVRRGASPRSTFT